MTTETVQEPFDLFNLIEEERQKAYDKGIADGERIGYEKAKEERELSLRLFQNIVAKILEEKRRLIDHLKPELIEFALVVSEKVIRSELSQKEKLVKLIDSYLALALPEFQGEIVKVILHPEDLMMITEEIEHLNGSAKEMKGVKFLSDPLICRGDIRIETKNHLLNFILTRELDDLRSKVLRDVES